MHLMPTPFELEKVRVILRYLQLVRIKVLLSAAIVLALSTFPLLARENYAILVGVSRYENLAERYWLNGPANDVKLAYHYLTTEVSPAFNSENIAVLADGVDGATSPTLSAIRTAFQQVTEQVEDGDFVYIHLAGHGSQAPALRADEELDGLDEVFLPIDVGFWNDTVGKIGNGLVDDEIGEMLDKLTSRGADVWIVFDSCHSGTATRAAPINDDDTRLRKVSSDALGVPEGYAAKRRKSLKSRKKLIIKSTSQGSEEGQITAFYAAQTTETTPETRMPKGQTERHIYGVFTYVLFETMLRNPGISYRQLGQEILRQYSVKNLTKTTPMFSGALDETLFSAGAQKRVFQWPIEPIGAGYSIPAGAVHGLEVGDELVLFENASNNSNQALGSFTVTKADLLHSNAEPTGQFEIPIGGFLRVEQSNLHLELTVALPEKSGDPILDTTAQNALSELVTRNSKNQRLRFVETDETADLRLAFVEESDRPEALWLLPGTGLWEKDSAATIPSVLVAGQTSLELANNLEKLLVHIGRAQNLLRLGGAYGIGDSDINAALLVKAAGTKNLRKMDSAHIPSLFPNDEVHLQAKNTSDSPIDVNVLFVGSDYSIAHIFAGRLQPEDTFKKGLIRVTDSTTGRERILVITHPASQHSAVQNLSFLQQDAISLTRGNGQSTFVEALSEAGFGQGGTRGFPALGSDVSSSGAILQFELNVNSGERPKTE